MPRRLRTFLYRDDAIVAQYLEQLEGGAYDEENIRRTTGSDGSVGAGIGLGPVELKGSRGKSAAHKSELSLRQTGPSRFSRFYALARGSGDVQTLDETDDTTWDRLQPGAIIDAAVVLEIPTLLKSIELASRAPALLPLLDAISPIRDDEGRPVIDPVELRAMRRQLSSAEDTAAATKAVPLPVIASLASDQRYKFFTRLKRTSVRVDQIGDLDGQARLIGAVHCRLPRGKAQVVGHVPGMSPPRRPIRKRSTAAIGAGITLRYPSAVLTPVAIFR